MKYTSLMVTNATLIFCSLITGCTTENDLRAQGQATQGDDSVVIDSTIEYAKCSGSAQETHLWADIRVECSQALKDKVKALDLFKKWKDGDPTIIDLVEKGVVTKPIFYLFLRRQDGEQSIAPIETSYPKVMVAHTTAGDGTYEDLCAASAGGTNIILPPGVDASTIVVEMRKNPEVSTTNDALLPSDALEMKQVSLGQNFDFGFDENGNVRSYTRYVRAKCYPTKGAGTKYHVTTDENVNGNTFALNSHCTTTQYDVLDFSIFSNASFFPKIKASVQPVNQNKQPFSIDIPVNSIGHSTGGAGPDLYQTGRYFSVETAGEKFVSFNIAEGMPEYDLHLESSCYEAANVRRQNSAFGAANNTPAK